MKQKGIFLRKNPLNQVGFKKKNKLIGYNGF